MAQSNFDLLQSPDGAIGSGSTLNLRLSNGAPIEALYIDTNIPHELLTKISIVNGADDHWPTSGDQIVNLFEKHRDRVVAPDDFLPIRFSDPDSLMMDVQGLTALVPESGDSWLLKVEIGTLPATPAEGWRFFVWSETTSPVKMVNDGSGKIIPIQRVRTLERRLDKKVITSAVEGVNTFDKLIKGQNINIRTIYIKGDVSEVEFEGKRGGQIVNRWRLSKKLNSYIQKVRAQKNGIKDIAGYFIIDPISSGFTFADMMVTNYDEINIKFKCETAGTVEFITDYVKRR
ncbi:major capsid protein P2 [Marinomonas atlantica]|uniref:major capsid protein P2 n=1 Tax=Marinomonas atlantica TaxID=1806668 RepID=UPI0008342BBE|nr:major capsid protein P2 [Marinomonas atlantica]